MNPSTPEHRGRIRLPLLVLGALTGLVLGGAELVGRTERQTADLPDDVVARVNHRNISLARYQAVLGDLTADRRSPVTAEDRAFVLQRLIDEELLVLKGFQMGLAESLPDVRKAVAAAVIAQTVAEAEAIEPDERQLHELYDADPGFFTRTARYRVVWLRGPAVAVDDVAELENAISHLRAGTEPETVAAMMGLQWVRELPFELIPLSKLRDYLGSELSRAAVGLRPGAAAGPLMDREQVHILYLAEYLPTELPPFERISPLVEAEFTRRQGDAAVQLQLERLRRESEIIVDNDKLD